MHWWNHIPEHINPNIIAIGSFQIRYYGLMYVAAFGTIYLLVLGRLKRKIRIFQRRYSEIFHNGPDFKHCHDIRRYFHHADQKK